MKLDLIKPFLVQRLSFKINPPENPSFDNLLQCDYMGSAEFEWGALPKSLKTFTNNFSNIKIDKVENIVNDKGLPLIVIGQGDATQEYIKSFVNDLFNDKLHLKESLYIKSSKHNNTTVVSGIKHLEKIQVWWDIENHVIMSFGSDNAMKIYNSIISLRQKCIESKNTEWYADPLD
jgi:hypothetical protein